MQLLRQRTPPPEPLEPLLLAFLSPPGFPPLGFGGTPRFAATPVELPGAVGDKPLEEEEVEPKASSPGFAPDEGLLELEKLSLNGRFPVPEVCKGWLVTVGLAGASRLLLTSPGAPEVEAKASSVGVLPVKTSELAILSLNCRFSDVFVCKGWLVAVGLAGAS